jgi:hypothetical protein
LARSLTTGALGGLALTTVVSTAHKGEAIYQPYTILVLSLALLLWINRDLTPRERFLTFVGGFMIASLILYAYLVLWVNPDALGIPLLGHAWRVAFLLGVGATLGAVTTFLTGFRAK